MSNRVKDEDIEIVKSKEDEILNKEILDIYDKNFEKIGTATRGEIHEKGIYIKQFIVGLKKIQKTENTAISSREQCIKVTQVFMG